MLLTHFLNFRGTAWEIIQIQVQYLYYGYGRDLINTKTMPVRAKLCRTNCVLLCNTNKHTNAKNIEQQQHRRQEQQLLRK